MEDIINYIVASVVGWSIWTTKRIYDLDKKIALNTQNDEAVRAALNEFKKSIEDLAKQVNDMRVMIAEEFGRRKNGKDG